MTDQLTLPLRKGATLSNSQQYNLQGLLEWLESIRGTEDRKKLWPLVDFVSDEYSPLEALRAGWALANDRQRDYIAVNIMGLKIDPTRPHGSRGRYLDDGERSEAAMRGERFTIDKNISWD